MTKTDGHKEERYDPKNKDHVKRIKKLIKEKIEEGYYLYGASKDGPFMVLRNPKDIDDEKRFKEIAIKH